MKQFITLCVLMTEENMSASTSNFRWSECDRNQPVALGCQNQYLGIRVKPRARHCPSCDSIVYSRRHSLCGVCGDALQRTAGPNNSVLLVPSISSGGFTRGARLRIHQRPVGCHGYRKCTPQSIGHSPVLWARMSAGTGYELQESGHRGDRWKSRHRF